MSTKIESTNYPFFPFEIKRCQKWRKEMLWLTCSRLSSSCSEPVSPLLLMGISIVAALLIMLSVIMAFVCRKKRRGGGGVRTATFRQSKNMKKIKKLLRRGETKATKSLSRCESNYSKRRMEEAFNRPRKALWAKTTHLWLSKTHTPQQWAAVVKWPLYSKAWLQDGR